MDSHYPIIMSHSFIDPSADDSFILFRSHLNLVRDRQKEKKEDNSRQTGDNNI